MKKIYVYSPQSKTGKTTIANDIALNLSKKHLTCLVECNRYTAYSIYLNDKVKEQQKSLTNVYNNLEVSEQLIQSKHSEKFFFLSKNITDELLDLYNINSEVYYKMMDYLEKHFEYIIIDLPSNYIEKMLIDSISLITKEDYLVIILDENLQTYKLLKDYDNYFNSILLNVNPKKLFYIKNKSNGFLETKIAENILNSLSLLKSEYKLLEMPYIKEFTLYGNEGKSILNSPGTKKEKQYIKMVQEGCNIILEKDSNYSKTNKKKKTKKGFFSFFKSKN